MKDSPFVKPGGAQNITKPVMNAPTNSFARPGGATTIPSGSGPNRFPDDLAGKVGFSERA